MSSFLNKFLRQFLAPASDTIVIILVSNVNTRHTLIEFPQKIILYLWKSAKYTVLRASILIMWNNFLTAKHAVFNFGSFIFPVQMIINFHTPKLCTSMSVFAYSIVNGAYNEFIGVNLTIFATRRDPPPLINVR
jgi:hypothetical protein